jgi:predicted PurR-regulated permease PerM
MKNFRWDKKYLYWGLTALCVIVCCIAFFWILQSWPSISDTISTIFHILSPFVWGLVIAYLLNPMMCLFERALFRPLGGMIFRKKSSRAKKLARAVSIICSLLVAGIVIAALMWLIIPGYT